MTTATQPDDSMLDARLTGVPLADLVGLCTGSARSASEKAPTRTPLTLLPYQKRWVQDTASVRVAVKARRVGLSWAQAYSDVVRAAYTGNVTYMSYDLEMTEGYLQDCVFWLKRLGRGVRESGGHLTYRRRQRRIIMGSGYQIETVASKARKFRSRGRPGAHFDIDEAAFIDDLPAVLEAVQAVTMWGATVAIWSTHNGADNAFAQLVDDIEAGRLPYSLHRIPLRLALEQGLHKRIVAHQKVLAADPLDLLRPADCATPSPTWTIESQQTWEAGLRAQYPSREAAEQELDCVPRPARANWLDILDVQGCQDSQAGQPDRYRGGSTWIGYDIARRRDLSVLTVLERCEDLFWARQLVIMQDHDFAHQLQRLKELVDRYRPLSIWIDQTGMGEAIVEQARSLYGPRVHGVIMTSRRRLEIAWKLRTFIQQRLVRLPPDDEYRRDLLSVQREQIDGREVVRGAKHTSQGHGDRFWSLALGLAATQETPRVTYDYKKFRLQRRRLRRSVL